MVGIPQSVNFRSSNAKYFIFALSISNKESHQYNILRKNAETAGEMILCLCVETVRHLKSAGVF